MKLINPWSNDLKAFQKNIHSMKEWKGDNYFSKEFLLSDFQKQWDFVLRSYQERQKSRGNNVLEDINTNLAMRGDFASLLYSLGQTCIDYAFYSRYIDDNVQELLNGLYLAGRLRYVINLIEPQAFSGYDCMHGRDILLYGACFDVRVLNGYLQTKPGPFKVGPTYTKMQAIGFNALISNDQRVKENAIEIITQSLLKKGFGKWDKAVLNCMVATLTLNSELFSESLQTVLSLHASFALAQGFMKYTALPAHTLYNFAYFAFKDSGFDPPIEPSHKYWDHELWQLVKQNQQKEFVIDLKEVSPVLANWMSEVPLTLDFTLLENEPKAPDPEEPQRPQIPNDVLENIYWKFDKERIYTLVENYKKDLGSSIFDKEYLLKTYTERWNQIIYGSQNSDSLKNNLFKYLTDLNQDIIQYAMYSRLVTGDVTEFFNGIYTYGRLSYVHNLFHLGILGGSTYVNLLESSAIHDQAVLDSYWKNILGLLEDEPSRFYPKAQLIGLEALIGTYDKDSVIKHLSVAISEQELKPWDKAFLTCILSIINLEKSAFERSLEESFELHVTKSFGKGLFKYISLSAHTLYNFAYFRFKNDGLEPPKEPNHQFWDHELWQLVKDSYKPEFIIDLNKVSPVLAQWIEELPLELDFNLLKLKSN